MNKLDFARRNVERTRAILKERIKTEKERPLTLEEKDLFNLKYMRYTISMGSLWYQVGCIATLDRAIRKLEKDMGKGGRRKKRPLEDSPGYE